MAVTVAQQPQNRDAAYGPNFVTLNNLGTAEKFAVRIRDWYSNEILALVSQSPNAVGRAQFDLQQIFQQYVNVSDTDIETIGGIGYDILNDSSAESAAFKVEVGTMTGSLFTADSTLTQKIQVNAVKPYNQTTWNTIYDQWRAIVSGDDSNPPCTVVDRRGKLLSDRPRNQYPAGVLPPSVDAGTDYLAVKLSDNDYYTASYMSELGRTGAPFPDALTQNIEAFEICEINDVNGIIQRTYIPNTTTNDGGPNVTYQQGTAPTWPYIFVTMGVGPKNLEGMQYTNTGGSTATFNFNANTDRYWIIPRAYSPAQCSQQYLSQATHEPVLVILDNQQPCNEFPTVQVSWNNQYGFRDYYEFKLKQVASQKQNSNTYTKTWNDYNNTVAGYGSGAGAGLLEGGETVFNKSVVTTINMNTKYLSDADAYYLNGLFKSANVRMRTNSDNLVEFTDWATYTGNNWFPIVLQNSSYTEKNYRMNRLFQFELQAALAHNPQIQRGS